MAHSKQDCSYGLKKSKYTAWAIITTQFLFPLATAFSPSISFAQQTFSEEQERTVANTATNLASIVGSGDATKQTGNFLRNSATQQTGDALQKWLQQFGTTRLQLNLDERFGLEGSQFDMLLPLSNQQDLLTFSQFGIRHIDERTTVNIGAGQRYFTPQWMLGYNLFLDHEQKRSHNRLGIGAEYARDYIKLAANGYVALSDWKEALDLYGFEEKPANGFDIRAESYLPSYPQLGTKVMYEQYFGDDVALFGKDNRQSNPAAVTLGVNYTPFPLATIGVDYKAGNSGMNETRLNFSVNYRFGVSLSEQFDPNALAFKRSLAGSRLDLVERNNQMVMRYREQSRINLFLSPVIGNANQTLELVAKVTSNNPLDRIEWNAPLLLAAGGTITPKGIDSLLITLPAYQPGGRSANTYDLNAVAYDSKGYASKPETTQIIVDGYAIHPSASSLFSVSSQLTAGAQSSTELTLVLVDTNNQPIAGIADNITLSVKEQALPDTMGKAVNPKAGALSFAADDSTKYTLSPIKESSTPGTYTSTLTGGNKTARLVLTAVVEQETIETLSTIIDLIADEKSAVLPEANSEGALKLEIEESVAVGNNNSASITIRDAHNNPIPNYPVIFNTIEGEKAITTNGKGIATLIFTSAKVGDYVVSVTIGDQTQSVTAKFKADESSAALPEAGSEGALALATTTAVTVGTNNSAALIIRDGNANAIPDYSVTFSTPDGDKVVNTDKEGKATLSFTSKTSGDYVVSVTLGGKTQSVTAQFKADESSAALPEAGSEGALALTTTTAVTVGANNTAALIIRDGNANAIPDYSVTFSTPDGDKVINTDKEGKATLTFTSKTSGDYVVSVTLGGKTQSVTAQFKADESSAALPEAGSEGALALATTTAVTVGTNNTAALIIRDSNANAIPDYSVTFSTPDGDKVATTDKEGKATLTFTSQTSGDYVVSVTLGGKTQSVTAQFKADESSAALPEAGSEGALALATTTAVTVGANNTAALIIRDGNANAIPDYSVTFSTPDGDKVVKTDKEGKATLTFTSKTSGDYVVSVTLGGKTQSVTAQFKADESSATLPEAGSEGALALTTTTVVTVGSNNSAALIIRDGNANAIPDYSVTFSTPDGDKVATTDKEGKATLTFTSKTSGDYVVSVTLGGKTQSVTAQFKADESSAALPEAGSEGALALTTTAVTVGTNNTAALTIRDGNANAIPDYSVTFSTPDGDKVVKTDKEGKATLTFTSKTSGDYVVSVTLGGKTQSVTAQFKADESSAALPEAGSEEALALATTTPVTIKLNNSASVMIRDGNGNAIPDYSVTFTTPDGDKVIKTDKDGKAILNFTSQTSRDYKVSVTLGSKTQNVTAKFIDVVKINDVSINGAAFNTSSGIPKNAFAGANFTLRINNDTQYYKFTSSDENAATVNSNGLVTFKAQPSGEVIITIASTLNVEDKTSYTLKINRWWRNDSNKTAIYSANMCTTEFGSGYRLPTQKELTNGQDGVEATRSGDSLFGEWGDMSVYKWTVGNGASRYWSSDRRSLAADEPGALGGTFYSANLKDGAWDWLYETMEHTFACIKN